MNQPGSVEQVCRGTIRGVRHGLLLVVACLALTGSLSAQELRWKPLMNGLAVTLWHPPAACQETTPLLIVNIDPELFRFSVYQFRDEGLTSPLTVHEWQQRTGATFLFNAGLFREDYSYLGLLMKGGRLLGSKRHPSWQALFAAEPSENGQRKARVLDLAHESFQEEMPPYREAAQSLMLMDRSGKPRVRQTGKRAYQTVVAEDESGHILVMKTTDPVTLYGLAECLRSGLSAIRQAMVMDGGSSSDLLFSPELSPVRVQEGSEDTWESIVEGNVARHIPLPAVIGIRPRLGPMRNGPTR